VSNMESVNFDALYTMMKGEPGTRKSTQALSYPTPQYWFSWDRKMEGIYLPMKKWGIDPKQVTFDDYDDWNKAKVKLEKFQVDCPFRTLVFDSLTSMADMTLRQTNKMKYGVTRQSGAAAGKLIAGIAVNEIEDYNAESSALQELVALSKDINKFHKVNVILIAHVVQAEYRSTTTNITHISRQIVTAGKKVAPKIPAYCLEVYHFNIKKGFVEGAGGEYSLLTEHTGDDFARTALGMDKEIVFGDKPIYDTYIKPAIAKMKALPEPPQRF
jgi:AAA domain